LCSDAGVRHRADGDGDRRCPGIAERAGHDGQAGGDHQRLAGPTARPCDREGLDGWLDRGEVTTPIVPLTGTLDEKNQWLFNAAAPGEQYRYLVLDVPGGGNVLISVYASEPERLTDIIGPAMEIVDHLTFIAR
jgi:hypothetical protein